MYWDNITILQAVDWHQKQVGGRDVQLLDGRELMEEVAGEQIVDDNRSLGFIRELEIAADEGYLTFRIDSATANTPQLRNTYPYQFLQRIRSFALTVKGQDRARGIRVIQPLPNPAEDDGRPISLLVMQQIAHAIAEEYSPEQILIFLREADVVGDRPSLPDHLSDVHADPGRFVYEVLRNLETYGSEGRRSLRSFIGSWLDDRLISGPTDELRADLVDKLARRAWYVQDGNLVIGEIAAGTKARSPILRDARLVALHPKIADVSAQLFKDGHRSAGVFEAAKAVNNRVKEMTGLPGDGVGMMGSALKDEEPALTLGDIATQTGKDIQAGYRFLFMGSQLAIRNPPAHEQFGELDNDEAFELLALVSLLMRKLDQARNRRDET